MTYVIILLLTVNGIEKIELKTNGLHCSEIADAWREVNTIYYDSQTIDPNSPKEQQGNYTRDGKLMIGHLCY